MAENHMNVALFLFFYIYDLLFEVFVSGNSSFRVELSLISASKRGRMTIVSPQPVDFARIPGQVHQRKGKVDVAQLVPYVFSLSDTFSAFTAWLAVCVCFSFSCLFLFLAVHTSTLHPLTSIVCFVGRSC